MILQDPMTSLNPLFRIGDQVSEPLRVHLGMDRDTADIRVTELLESVTLGGWAAEREALVLHAGPELDCACRRGCSCLCCPRRSDGDPAAQS